MGLLTSLSNIFNTGNFMGMNTENTPGLSKEQANPGLFKNILGTVNSMMLAQPDYLKNAMNQESLRASQISNQNAPIANALRNALTGEQVQGQSIRNQFLPETLRSSSESQQANAAYKKSLLDYLPLNMQIKQQNAQAASNRSSPEMIQARIALMKSLIEHPERHGSAFGKRLKEEARIQNGLLPTGEAPTMENLQTGRYQATNSTPSYPQGEGQPGLSQQQPGTQGQTRLPDDQLQKMKNQSQLKMLKDTTDSDTRRRNLFATNVEKTVDAIDPKIFSVYSGIEGKAKYLRDKAASMAGKAPEEYKQYQSTVNTLVKLLTSQVRQFYGDSIQPSVREELEYLSNTSTWEDPDTATRRFQDFMNVLGQEMQTYRDATKGVGVYQGEGGHSQGQAKEKGKPQPMQISSEQAAAELARRRGAK